MKRVIKVQEDRLGMVSNAGKVNVRRMAERIGDCGPGC